MAAIRFPPAGEAALSGTRGFDQAGPGAIIQLPSDRATL
jgi:hypothetical protein